MWKRSGRRQKVSSRLVSINLQSIISKKLAQYTALSEHCQEMLRSFLISPTGLHAVHVFAARHDLKQLAEPLAKLSNQQVQDLLRLPVTQAHRSSGATALHFACKAGNQENIRYLMSQGLRLSDETDSGLSCVDFADASEKLDELIDAVFPDEEDCDEDADSNYDDNASERSREITRQSSLTDVNFIHLLDKRTGALRLPSRTKAKECLASIEASIASEDLSAKEQNKSNERSGMSILIKAIKSDSPEIYRCALKLCRVTAETEADFPEFYRERLFDISNEYELGNVCDRFLTIPFNETSELSIIDAAVCLDKIDILIDLVLTRQFNLIPACINLLIQLQPRIAKSEGKSEQLQLLYSKVISVAMNALDAMYSNADEEERQLLFQYITGSLWDDDWETTGPKFPCRMENGSTKPYTLMEMIEEAGDGDLFASDCLHNLIESEWSNAYSRYRENCCKRKFSVKPRIMDLPTTFKFWPADLVMIAYLLSFTLQEVLDICTRSKRRRAKICGIEIKKIPRELQGCAQPTRLFRLDIDVGRAAAEACHVGLHLQLCHRGGQLLDVHQYQLNGLPGTLPRCVS
ncbi:hypothetical protein BOX15_Mlig004347g1 [Macrostomum lignano]|uniref:Uncharacterized protein n=1 Tax=Macrostomum lignano TaxID=282301 RepID=A0A267H5B5_9PLAT|nr:hypothetical protein BOX15_Mlig004347g1 [Macrostomum lignano]